MSDYSKTYAPWDETEVALLNQYQKDERFHPFTCGTNSKHPVLVATSDGWICEACGYTQNWAHTFMFSTGVEAAEKRIDWVFQNAFQRANDPALLDWMSLRFELKRLRAGKFTPDERRNHGTVEPLTISADDFETLALMGVTKDGRMRLGDGAADRVLALARRLVSEEKNGTVS